MHRLYMCRLRRCNRPPLPTEVFAKDILSYLISRREDAALTWASFFLVFLTCLPLFPGRPVGPLFPATPDPPFVPCSPWEKSSGIIRLNQTPNCPYTTYSIILTFCPSIPGKPMEPCMKTKWELGVRKVIISAEQRSITSFTEAQVSLKCRDLRERVKSSTLYSNLYIYSLWF